MSPKIRHASIAASGHWPYAHRGTALLVEDDADQREFVRRRLTDRGWIVDEADDGILGLAAMEAIQADVIVLDYRLPGINGLRLTERIRRMNPTMPIVILSGFLTPKLVADFEGAGADMVLDKEEDWEGPLMSAVQELAWQRRAASHAS